MTRSFPHCSTLLACALALAAHAQEAPAPPGGQGASSSTVKIKARTNPGDLPYMNAVRKLQDAIPDQHAELAPLRSGHYDGLKACFRAAGGIVFVGDMPTADATVGNCRVVKFDPAQDANEKVEFVGQVNAVTMVDTDAYLHAKG